MRVNKIKGNGIEKENMKETQMKKKKKKQQQEEAKEEDGRQGRKNRLKEKKEMK